MSTTKIVIYSPHTIFSTALMSAAAETTVLEHKIHILPNNSTRSDQILLWPKFNQSFNKQLLVCQVRNLITLSELLLIWKDIIKAYTYFTLKNKSEFFPHSVPDKKFLPNKKGHSSKCWSLETSGLIQHQVNNSLDVYTSSPRG